MAYQDQTTSDANISMSVIWEYLTEDERRYLFGCLLPIPAALVPFERVDRLLYWFNQGHGMNQALLRACKEAGLELEYILASDCHRIKK